MAPIIPRTQGRDGLAVLLAAHRPLQRHVLQAPLLAQLRQSAPSPNAAPAHFAAPAHRAASANTVPPPAVPVGGPTPVQRRLAASASLPLRPASAPAAPLLAPRLAATTAGATEPETAAAGPLPTAAHDLLAAGDAQDRAEAPLPEIADAAELPGDGEPTDVQSQAPSGWGLDETRQAGQAAPALLPAPPPMETSLQGQSEPPLPPSAAAPLSSAVAPSSLDRGARAVAALHTVESRADLAEHSAASPLATPTSPPPTHERSLQRGVEAFERGELVASASGAIDQSATPEDLDDAAAPPASPALPLASPTTYRRGDPAVSATALAAPAAAGVALAGQEARDAAAEPPPAPTQGRPAPEPRAADAPLPDQPPRARETLPPVLPASPPANAPTGPALPATDTPATDTPVAPTLLSGPATSTETSAWDVDNAPAAAEPRSVAAVVGDADPLSFAAEHLPTTSAAMDATAPLSVEVVSEQPSDASMATAATGPNVPAATAPAATAPAGTDPSAAVHRASTPPSAPPVAGLPAADGNTSAPEHIEPTLSPPLSPGKPTAQGPAEGKTGDVGSALTHRVAGERGASLPPTGTAEPTPAVPAQRSAADHEQQSDATVADVAMTAPTVVTAMPPAPAADALALEPEPARSPEAPALPGDSATASNINERVDVPFQSSPTAAAQSAGEPGDAVPAAAEQPPPAITSGPGAPRSALRQGAALPTAVGDAAPSAAPDAEPRWSPRTTSAGPATEPALGPEATGEAAPAGEATASSPHIAAALEELAVAPEQHAGAPAPEQIAEAGATAGLPAAVQRSVDMGTAPESTADLTAPGFPGVAAASTGVIAAETAIDSSDAPRDAPDPGGSSTAPINLPGASVSVLGDDEGGAATPLAAAEPGAATTATPAVSDMGEPAPPTAAEAEPDVQTATAAIQRTATAATPELNDAPVLETAPVSRTEPVLRTEPGLETVSPRGPRPIFRRRQPASDKPAAAPSPAPDPTTTERLERLANLLLGRTPAPASERQIASDTTARGKPSVTANAAQSTATEHYAAPSADSIALQRATSPAASAAATHRAPPDVDRSTRSGTGGSASAIDGQTPPTPTVQRATPLASAALLPDSVPRAARMHEAPPLSADFPVVSSAAQASAPNAVTAATGVAAAPAEPTRDRGGDADDAPRWGMPPLVQATYNGPSSDGAPDAHASAPRTYALPDAAAIESPRDPTGAPTLAARSAHTLAAGFEGWQGVASTLPSAPALPITAIAAANAPSAAAFLQRATDGAPTGAASTPGIRAAAPSTSASLLPAGALAAPATRVPPSLASDVPLAADDPHDIQSAEPPSTAADALPATSATVQPAVAPSTPPSAPGPVTSSARAGAAPAEDVASTIGGEHPPTPARDRGRWGNLPAPWEPLPTWLTAPAPEAVAPPTSLPVSPSLPMVVQRTVAAETSDRPVSVPEAPARSASGQQPEADLDALARQVYGILRQRLLMEQRRGG